MNIKYLVSLLIIFAAFSSNMADLNAPQRDKYLFVYETPTQIFAYVLIYTQSELNDLVCEVRQHAPKQTEEKEEKPYGDIIIIANDKNEILYRIFLEPTASFNHTLALEQQKQKKA